MFFWFNIIKHPFLESSCFEFYVTGIGFAVQASVFEVLGHEFRTWGVMFEVGG